MAISDERLRALKILREYPGLSAGQLAAKFWPHLVRGGPMNPALKATQWLQLLRQDKLVKRRFNCKLFGGTLPPGVRRPYYVYFLTTRGYDVCENEDRARRCCC